MLRAAFRVASPALPMTRITGSSKSVCGSRGSIRYSSAQSGWIVSTARPFSMDSRVVAVGVLRTTS